MPAQKSGHAPSDGCCRADGSSDGVSPPGAAEEDDDVVFVGAKRETTRLPHARYDCSEFDLMAAERYCDKCWCAICQVPVKKCIAWAEHCGTTASEARAINEAKRKESLTNRIANATPALPPAAGTGVAALLLDFRWLALRHTALSWLANCGHDVDGLMTTIVVGHEVSYDVAENVLKTLLATNEVVELDGALYLYPSVIIGEEPPLPGPPGPPLAVWLSMPAPPPPQTLQIEEKATARAQNQLAQQQNAWKIYYECRISSSAKLLTSQTHVREAWKEFYEQQALETARRLPSMMHSCLLQAWLTHFAQR